MANIAWIGTGGVAGKLTDNANWTGGTAPAGSDTALFNAGSQNVDPVLGQIAALAGIDIYPGYAGTIGGSGNEMDSSVAEIRHHGVAEFWFKDAAGTTVDVFINPTNPATVINLGGVTMTNVTLHSGNVALAGDHGTIGRLIVGGSATVVGNTGGSTVYTVLVMTGGTLTTAVGAATVIFNGGTLTQTGAVTNTTFYQTGGTYLNQSTGTITTYIGLGGFLDLGSSPKTITTLYEVPGFSLKGDIGGLHTVTNRFDWILT